MMQAISTKYLGPTTHRGPRVAAKCDAGRIVVSWDHALGIEKNHARAAKMLADKLGWSGSWHGGGIGGGYVYVRVVSAEMPKR